MLKPFPQYSQSPETFNVSCSSHNHTHCEGRNAETGFNRILVNWVLCHVSMDHSYRVLIRLDDLQLFEVQWVLLNYPESLLVARTRIFEADCKDCTCNNVHIAKGNCREVNTIFNQLILIFVLNRNYIALINILNDCWDLWLYPCLRALNIIPENYILAKDFQQEEWRSDWLKRVKGLRHRQLIRHSFVVLF